MSYQSIYKDGLFEGRLVLITGGGTGIGRCLAHELASLGAKVIVVGRREAPLQETVAEIERDGGAAAWASINIRDEEAVAEGVAALVAEHGPIDLLVNNAGGQFASPASGIRAKGWRAVIDTNLNGTFWMSQAVFNAGMSERGGAIVNVIADMRNGFPGMAHTGAARAGVDNLTKSLAIEWARHGVRVNAVAPGNVLSSGMTTYPEAILKMALPMMRGNPAGRMGSEAEIAAAIVYLASPAAAFTTGQTLYVDGGGSLVKTPMLPLDRHGKLPVWDGFHRKPELPELLKDDG